MASPRHRTTMEDLPRDVLSEILIRLLAKQLAQMRCINKSWNALLSDSSFARAHLHRSIHHNDEIFMFFPSVLSFNDTPITARSSRSPDVELINSIKLPFKPQCKNSYVNVIGSVDGLICFSYGTFHYDYHVHIWNPSLTATLTLPPCSLPFHKLDIGFGFDPRTDDYKVVKLRRFFQEPNNMVPQVEVYSMRKGSWESIPQSFPSDITMLWTEKQVCVDGHLHWLGDTDLEWKPETIVTFDLTAEIFSEIPLPDSVLNYDVYYKHSTVLGVLGGKLCVMTKVKDGGAYEVWVMDEYGLAESWVKHQVFPQFSGDILPYGFTSHNECIFRFYDNTGCFALHNPLTAKTKIFKSILGQSYMCKVVEYVDSLVWIEPAYRLKT